MFVDGGSTFSLGFFPMQAFILKQFVKLLAAESITKSKSYLQMIGDVPDFNFILYDMNMFNQLFCLRYEKCLNVYFS